MAKMARKRSKRKKARRFNKEKHTHKVEQKQKGAQLADERIAIMLCPSYTKKGTRVIVTTKVGVILVHVLQN